MKQFLYLVILTRHARYIYLRPGTCTFICMYIHVRIPIEVYKRDYLFIHTNYI